LKKKKKIILHRTVEYCSLHSHAGMEKELDAPLPPLHFVAITLDYRRVRRHGQFAVAWWEWEREREREEIVARRTFWLNFSVIPTASSLWVCWWTIIGYKTPWRTFQNLIIRFPSRLSYSSGHLCCHNTQCSNQILNHIF
jgi:hypothetical protein